MLMGRFASTAVSDAALSTGLRRRVVHDVLLQQHRRMDSTAPLLVSADPLLVADVQRLAAAAGVVPRVVGRPDQALRDWSAAPVVLVGADRADALAATCPPRRTPASAEVFIAAPAANVSVAGTATSISRTQARISSHCIATKMKTPTPATASPR